MPHVTRWFYAHVIAGAEGLLREQGLDVVIYDLAGRADNRDRFFGSSPLRHRVDGVLALCLSLSDDEVRELASLRLPGVSVGTTVPGWASVRIDDRDVAAQAVRHLVGLGHRRIAHLGGGPVQDPMSFRTPDDRREGYRQVLRDAGLPVVPELDVDVEWTIEGGADGMRRLLSLDLLPTAVFAGSDEVAIGALEVARAAGLSVPGDLSIIGVDDHEAARLVGLTTVAQPVDEQGRIAAQLLLTALTAGGSTGVAAVDGSSAEILVPTAVVIRATTGP
ncbi:MAG: substrate-binding domain-containing protein, partial [Actinomycetes bacterium]